VIINDDFFIGPEQYLKREMWKEVAVSLNEDLRLCLIDLADYGFQHPPFGLKKTLTGVSSDKIITFILKAKEKSQGIASVFIMGCRSKGWISARIVERLIPRRTPELNPAEQIWNILRRDYFANRVFDALDAATTQAEFGLAEMAANKSATRQLTNWPWISAILKT
jgi:hypothetical protein